MFVKFDEECLWFEVCVVVVVEFVVLLLVLLLKCDMWCDVCGYMYVRVSGRGRKGDDVAAIRMRDEVLIYVFDCDDLNCDD